MPNNKPPIPDADGDKKLTMRDVIAALDNEKFPDGSLKAEHPAHTLISTLGLTPTSAKKLFDGLKTGNPQAAAEARDTIQNITKIDELVARMQTDMRKMGKANSPQTRAEGAHDLAVLFQQSRIDMASEQGQSLFALVNTFTQTFPKGVEIKEDQAYRLLAQLVPPPAPVATSVPNNNSRRSSGIVVADNSTTRTR